VTDVELLADYLIVYSFWSWVG